MNPPIRPAHVYEPPCLGCRRLWEPPICHCAWCHRCFSNSNVFYLHMDGGNCAALLFEWHVGGRRFHLDSVIGVGDVWDLR